MGWNQEKLGSEVRSPVCCHWYFYQAILSFLKIATNKLTVTWQFVLIGNRYCLREKWGETGVKLGYVNISYP